MEWYEAAFDRLYPVLYAHRDVSEARRAMQTLGPFLEGRSPVLDLASGSGRYLETLLRRGHDAYGLDLSLYLLKASVDEWGHAGRLVQGDMRHLPFKDGALGGVINMFTSFGYFSIDTDNLIVLKEVHRILAAGGVFVFDFINAERIAARLLERSHRTAGEFAVDEHRRIEANGKYLVKRATVTSERTDFREEIEERLRLYTRDELKIMFESTGFQIDEIFGDYEGNRFVEGVSERVIFIVSKP